MQWLNNLYATLRLYTHVFQPLQKAVTKERRKPEPTATLIRLKLPTNGS
jgi:hypothetical protein